MVRSTIAASYVASYLIPLTSSWSGGTRTIVLTVIISAIAALVRPVADEEVDHAA